MITGINHITISVSNIEESFKFYKEILQFKPIMKSSYSAYLLCGNMWIALIEEKGIDHNNKTYSHIALNTQKRFFRTIVERLESNNIQQWQNNTSEGESFYFSDPSGNKLELHYSTLKNRIKSAKKEWKNAEFYE
jgi:catechol 2,3-dioxygenase-like lactoylglutathione lyase family enzyme